uniref:SHNi-TPR domain-containing protein n=1 Tax=Gongylonema pulchrum TaxID=637853 RepID=A0A183DCR5_9BILA
LGYFLSVQHTMTSQECADGTAAAAAGDEREDNLANFQVLLLEGKKAFIANRLKEAEAKFSEAAGISVEMYGDFAVETFEPHFLYGKTLLELAKIEDNVFSSALQGVPLKTQGDKQLDDSISDPEALSGPILLIFRLRIF